MDSDSKKSSEDREAYLKRKLGAGVGIFYLVNFLALFIGIWSIESLGNLEGIVIMLLALYGMNAATGIYLIKSA